VYKRCRGGGRTPALFTAKVFILKEITVTLRDNADEMPVYINMPSNYTINNLNVKSVVIKAPGNEKCKWLQC
jgi:hypothetical protein